MNYKRTRVFAIGFVLAVALALGAAPLAFADQLTISTLDVDDTPDTSIVAADPTVAYQVHLQNGEWQSWVSNKARAGATEPIDALKMTIESSIPGSIQYQVYVSGKGWQKVYADGLRAGTINTGAKVEAVRVALVGELGKYYDASCNVMTNEGTWLGWRRNGEVAGAAGSGAPIIGLKVKLLAKKEAAANSEGLLGVRYRARMQDGNWQLWTANGLNVGKKSNSSKIHGLALSLDAGAYSGEIYYRVRLSDGTWKPWRKGGQSTGNNANIEAVQIRLDGPIADKYDVVYRAYIPGVKWQKHVRNGETCGTTSRGLGISALSVELVDKSLRTGWVGSGTSWQYFDNGKPVARQWVVTKESPIDEMQGSFDKALHYWIDSTGYLAIDRVIKPKNARDAGAGFKAYAMTYGYIMTNSTKMIGKKWYSADANGHLTVLKGKRSELIERYVLWAINIAGGKKHGYSQKNRWGPDYDCSSLVVSALSNTGFQVGNATWTGNMKSELTKYGFRWRTNFKKLRRGDILLVHNSSRQHTEIYIGSNKTVGAHIAETGGINGVTGDQTGNEISVANYYPIWEGYLRYVGK